MRCYLIRDTQVTALSALPSLIPDDGIVIQTIKALDPTRFPLARLVGLWNALPGVDPVKRFKDRSTALSRLWSALESLPVSCNPGRTDSKQAALLELLQRPEGASLDQLMVVTGWQRHSVRGVLSGVVRKKLSLPLSSAVEDGVRIYRIAA
jgi:hypothetical protein